MLLFASREDLRYPENDRRFIEIHPIACMPVIDLLREAPQPFDIPALPKSIQVHPQLLLNHYRNGIDLRFRVFETYEAKLSEINLSCHTTPSPGLTPPPLSG